MHLLSSLRRKHPQQCLSTLRRSLLSSAHPAKVRLESRRLTRRVSSEHHDQTARRGCKPPQAVRRIHQVNPSWTAMTYEPRTMFPNEARQRITTEAMDKKENLAKLTTIDALVTGSGEGILGFSQGCRRAHHD